MIRKSAHRFNLHVDPNCINKQDCSFWCSSILEKLITIIEDNLISIKKFRSDFIRLIHNQIVEFFAWKHKIHNNYTVMTLWATELLKSTMWTQFFSCENSSEIFKQTNKKRACMHTFLILPIILILHYSQRWI